MIGNDYDRDAVIELSITTGWYEAAMHYREWVSNNAVWWPEIDENGRVDTPQWLQELNVWTKTENWNGETPADTTRLVPVSYTHLYNSLNMCDTMRLQSKVKPRGHKK